MGQFEAELLNAIGSERRRVLEYDVLRGSRSAIASHVRQKIELDPVLLNKIYKSRQTRFDDATNNAQTCVASSHTDHPSSIMSYVR